MLRDSGAAAVHLAIHSPPVRHPCFYGIDMSTEEELFARRFEGGLDAVEIAAADALGADSLTYLPVEKWTRPSEARGAPRVSTVTTPIPYRREIVKESPGSDAVRPNDVGLARTAALGDTIVTCSTAPIDGMIRHGCGFARPL